MRGKDLESTLFQRYNLDHVPAFRLNPVRRKYRRKLVRLICEGRIRLEHFLACPCGSDSLRRIADKDRFGLLFSNFICKNCGLLVLSPRISDKTLSLYYKEIYHPLIFGVPQGTLLENLVRDKQGEKIFDFVKDYLKKSIINVCEVGLAGGYNLLTFQDLGKCKGIECKLYRSEYEEHYAAHAKEKGISVTNGGIEFLSQLGVKFDVIILSHVLEHFFSTKRELNTLRELLNDDGLLYVEVPGVINLLIYSNDLIEYLVHAHNYNFNLNSLERILNITGFAMVSGNEKVQALFQKGNANNNASLSERSTLSR